MLDLLDIDNTYVSHLDLCHLYHTSVCLVKKIKLICSNISLWNLHNLCMNVASLVVWQALEEVVKGKSFVPPLVLKAPGENGCEQIIAKE